MSFHFQKQDNYTLGKCKYPVEVMKGELGGALSL